MLDVLIVSYKNKIELLPLCGFKNLPMKQLLLVLALFPAILCAQKNPNAIQITYTKSSNGQVVENQDRIIAFANDSQAFITSENIEKNTAKVPYETSVFDTKSHFYYQTTQLSANKITTTVDSTSINKQIFELKDAYKTILGYKCQKAVTSINSNTIEVWFTNAIKIHAAPTQLGLNLGLVLEVTRNGNFTIAATNIKFLKSIPKHLTSQTRAAATVDMLTYRDQVWKSQFTTIPVFTNERINFSDALKPNDSVLRYSKGTVIVTKVKLPKIKKGSRIFVDVSSYSDGDAYDRTGSVFIIPTQHTSSFFDGLNNGIATLPLYENGNGKKYQGVVRTNNYSPTVELMRFFTPFGVQKYNTIKLKNKVWQDSAFYRQDISDIHPLLENDEVWIGANISNYDKGGHKISVNLTIHPEETALDEANFAMPLFNTNNILEMSGQEYATMFNVDKGLQVTFTLDKNLQNASLRYITTGHGGWENGDEFVPKTNTILLNSIEKHSFIPWRTDCGSYRSYNPASGNFTNGLSSSDYSRSNWCPGMTTNPVSIPLGDLPAGTHTIQIKIPQGAPEGNSFSSWNISGVLLGTIKN